MNTVSENKFLSLTEEFPDSIINPFLIVHSMNVDQISGKTIQGNGTLKFVEVVISESSNFEHISCILEFFNCTFETNFQLKENHRISGVTTLKDGITLEIDTCLAERKVIQGNGKVVLSGRIQNMRKFKHIKCEKCLSNITFG
tara:strand:- start:161 stop:589 length:429 start_codon:yes stop_codon:yes gene_type:complete